MEKVKQQSPSKLLIEKIAIDKALLLLNEIEIPTTEVCKFVYGSKTKKSTLNQKKTGVSPLFFEESCKIIDFYGDIAKKINKLIHD